MRLIYHHANHHAIAHDGTVREPPALELEAERLGVGDPLSALGLDLGREAVDELDEGADGGGVFYAVQARRPSQLLLRVPCCCCCD